MTIKAEPELGPLLHKEVSPTAANAHDRKYPDGGVQAYRVLMAPGGGGAVGKQATVDAATGDEAALKALGQNPGWKVAYVGPASDPDFPRLPDEAA
jgi:hypothetical protein